MPPIIKSTLLLLFFISTTHLLAQSNVLDIANKEFELHDYQNALKHYQEAAASLPSSESIQAKIGDCHFYLNNLLAARDAYAKAIDARLITPPQMFLYAKTLMGLGEYDNAKQWFTYYGEGDPVTGENYTKACEIAINRKNEAPIYEVRKVGVNSSSSDFGVSFYGNQLVFASMQKRRDGENPVVAQQNQLFISSISDNGMIAQSNYLHNKLQAQYGAGPISFSKDGKKVAFTKNNFKSGIRQIPSSGWEMSLYTADVANDGSWKNVRPFPHNGSSFSTGFPHYSEDGQMLYFASNRPDGFGGYDIFVSKKVGGEWTLPENLGNTINSPGNEITPFKTGNYLYFSSDWHPGFGGFDIFKAEQRSGNWAKIFHQGTGLNSTYDDMGFIYDTKKNSAYFTSNRSGGKGNEDIYLARKSLQKFIVSVTEIDKKTPIKDAILDFSACGQSAIRTDKDGKFRFQVEGSFDCTFEIRKDNYNTTSYTISSDGKGGLKNIPIILRKEGSSILPDEVITGIEETNPSEIKSNTYAGKVVDFVQTNGLSNVFIKAINKADATVSKAKTDQAGNYQLQLNAQSSYIITFSKEGYTEINRVIATQDGADKSILDVTSMKAVSTVIPTPTEIATTPPTPNETSGSSSSTTILEGYAVQIAAYGIDQEINVKRRDDIERLGNVYTREAGQFKRVRVGIFATKAHAQTVKRDLAKLGYGDAYVVNEKVDQLMDKVLLQMGQPAATEDRSAVLTEEVSTKDVPPISQKYFVRLGAFSKPQNVDTTKIKSYGPISSYQKGGLTILLVGTGTQLDRAKRLQQSIRAAGFDGAYIVQKNNDGQYTKVL